MYGAVGCDAINGGRLTWIGPAGRLDRMSAMDIALDEARAAGGRGEVPVGAAVVDGKTGILVARAGNEVEARGDPTAHAEMLVLRAAGGARGGPRLEICDLYVTLEPCPMCAQAIAFGRIRRLYFGAYDPKGGGVDHGPRIFQQSTCHHQPETYGGLAERVCANLLTSFFAE